MIRPLHHRGPDDTQVFTDRGDGVGVGLAHARLSIIDISGGRQPVHNEDQTIWTVFNGEIFNYLELRTELEAKGHRFYTRSDTEVIVHAYEEFGVRLRPPLQRAVRHRAVGPPAASGWCWPATGWACGRSSTTAKATGCSSPRRSRASSPCPGSSGALSRRALAQVFHFWSPLEPASLFEDVYMVPPGHLLIAEKARDHRAPVLGLDLPDRGGRLRPPDRRTTPTSCATCSSMRSACGCAPTCRWAPT